MVGSVGAGEERTPRRQFGDGGRPVASPLGARKECRVMPRSPEDIKTESWHRFYASTANNRAWELAELQASEVDLRELLNAAHAAAWHWQAVGNELNRMRAVMLLAQAHAMAGLGSSALAYADEMRSYFLARPSTPDWELAFVHTVHAYAASVAGSAEQHSESYVRAARALESIADEKDRSIVERVYRHVPAP